MKTTGTFRSILFAFVSALPLTAHAVCYVNGAATGANNGSTWNDAYSNPQFALLNSACAEIWVARGAYKPTAGADPTISFEIPSGVTMYGGFAGNETLRDQRAPDVNLTILSGDLGNDDANVTGSQVDVTTDDIRGTNTYHVVYMNGVPASSGKPAITGSTVLDGFVITGGNAASTALSARGGGLLCYGEGSGRDDTDAKLGCSPTLRDVIFSGNSAADKGGGLYDDATDSGTSSPTLIGVTFTGNHAGNAGGAVYNDASNGGVSSPSFTNVIFFGNSAQFGGAMYSLAQGIRDGANDIFFGSSNPTLSSVRFIGNSALTGGAMYTIGRDQGMSASRLNIVTFNDNRATDTTEGFGGAMYNDAEGAEVSASLVNSTLSENSALVGGAIFNTSSAGTAAFGATNVTFNGNTADTAGAIFNNTDAKGNTFAVLKNVILWGDVARSSRDHRELDNAGAVENTTIDHSVVQDGCPDSSTVSCTQLFIADPKLGPLAENGGFTRTLLPGTGSSAIDTGADAPDCPAMDQRGVSRPQGTHCDIGAVEVTPNPPPVADPKSVAIPENTSIQITLSGSDSNPGGPFSFVIATSVQHGALLIADNIVTYKPSMDYTGPDSFSYTVTDSNGTSASATVSILVSSGPPVAKSFSVNVPHNSAASISVSATDANAGGPFAYTFAIVAPTLHGTILLSGDAGTYTPTHNYTGLDQFTYTATDINGTSLPATVTIHVAPALPIADPKSLTIPHNTAKQITLSGSDDDNLGGPFALAFVSVSQPSHGTLSPMAGNSITYTPNHDYSGPDSFTYEVTDQNGVSIPALVSITVIPGGVGPSPPVNTTSVPTLGTYGLISLAGLIGLTSVRRRRKV